MGEIGSIGGRDLSSSVVASLSSRRLERKIKIRSLGENKNGNRKKIPHFMVVNLFEFKIFELVVNLSENKHRKSFWDLECFEMLY